MSTAANIQAVRLAITSDFLPGWVTRLLRPGEACRLPSIVKGDTPCGPFVILKSLITLEICDGRVLAQSRPSRNDCDGRQDRADGVGWMVDGGVASVGLQRRSRVRSRRGVTHGAGVVSGSRAGRRLFFARQQHDSSRQTG